MSRDPRWRDALGRPVPPGSPEAVTPVSEEPLPPDEALPAARALLAEGRAFAAHEVLEASWKAAPPEQRDLWQGLAQLCVGTTHWQRGNAVGAARLLRRGAGRLATYDGPAFGLDPARLAERATRQAARIDAGQPPEEPVVDLG